MSTEQERGSRIRPRDKRLTRTVARYGRLDLLCLDLCRCRNYADTSTPGAQSFGLLHFHIAIRLDGAGFDLDGLTDAVRFAHEHADIASIDGTRIKWGQQLDIKVICADDHRNDIAGCCAKYATKSADAKGTLSSRIRDERQIERLPINYHHERLVRAA